MASRASLTILNLTALRALQGFLVGLQQALAVPLKLTESRGAISGEGADVSDDRREHHLSGMI